MIYVEVNDGWYVNVNHIIMIRPNGSDYTTLIYGFSECSESCSVKGTPKELVESIRKQIKEQICRTPELMEKVEDRFKLMDFE